MSSVGEKYPEEQKRLREMREQYVAIGPAGAFGCMMIDAMLTEMEQAMASGDVVRIVRAYAEAQGFKA